MTTYSFTDELLL